MKRKFGFFFSTLVTIGLCLLMLFWLSRVVERKNSYYKEADFFEEESDFDVLFLGTSHVMNGIFPMKLWNDDGIVSYNLGGHGNYLPVTYWVLKNALDYTDPKVVVIDCLQLRHDGKGVNGTESDYQHILFDAFPFSLNKYNAMRDLFPETRNMLEYLWDFVKYHGRWNSLTVNDFKPEAGAEKGAESRIHVATAEEYERIPDTQMLKGDTDGVKYLRKMIEECQSKGIEVLLIYLPFPASSAYQEEANRMEKIASEYGINCINFLKEDIVDFETDCYDSNSHLNPSGARKVTAYLGDYLTQNYHLQNQKANPSYQKWLEDYEEYRQFLFAKMKETGGFGECLTLLDGENLVADLFVDEGCYISPVRQNLIDQAGPAVNFVTVPEDQDVSTWDVKMIIRDPKTEKVICRKFYRLQKGLSGMTNKVE